MSITSDQLIPFLLLSLAAACDDDAGETSGSGTSEGGSSTAEVNGDTNETGPAVDAPRTWVLRDAQGVVVDAVVEPYCPYVSPESCGFPDFGADAVDYRCIIVHELEGSFIEARFGTATGSLLECNPTLSSWQEELGPGFLLDPACAGPPYSARGEDVQAGSTDREILLFQGTDPYYLGYSTSIDVAVGDLFYDRAFKEPDDCVSYPFTDSLVGPDGMTLYQWEIVPEWVQNLLPNPPYTIAFE